MNLQQFEQKVINNMTDADLQDVESLLAQPHYERIVSAHRSQLVIETLNIKRTVKHNSAQGRVLNQLYRYAHDCDDFTLLGFMAILHRCSSRVDYINAFMNNLY